MIGASELEALLRDEQVATKTFREKMLQQDYESQQLFATIERLSRTEKALEEKCREQVRILVRVNEVVTYNTWHRNGSYSLPRTPLRG